MQPQSARPDAMAALNTALPSVTLGSGSVHDYLDRVSGDMVTKVATLNLNNTTGSINLFQITGAVEIIKLFGVLTAKTTLTNCTNAYVDLYDSTTAVNISKATTLTLSGMTVGGIIYKNAVATSVLQLADANVGNIAEGAQALSFYRFMAVQKSGANTYIRFTYSTTDAPSNAQMTFYVEYRPLGTGTLVAV